MEKQGIGRFCHLTVRRIIPVALLVFWAAVPCLHGQDAHEEATSGKLVPDHADAGSKTTVVYEAPLNSSLPKEGVRALFGPGIRVGDAEPDAEGIAEFLEEGKLRITISVMPDAVPGERRVEIRWDHHRAIAQFWVGQEPTPGDLLLQGLPLPNQADVLGLRSSENSEATSLEATVPGETVFRVVLGSPLKLSHLQPGSEIDGELMRPVYVRDREVIPVSSHVRVVIDKVEKKKVEEKSKGFLNRLQHVRSMGLGKKSIYVVSFRSASLILQNGTSVPIDVSFIQAGEMVRLGAKGQEMKVGGGSAADLAKAAPIVGGRVEGVKRTKEQWEKYRHPLLTVLLEQPITLPLPTQQNVQTPSNVTGPVTLPAGTHARLLLLTTLSSSENHEGDVFQARLIEPVQVDGHVVLPEGSLFEGRIAKLTPPRRLSRAGSIRLVFDTLSVPEGSTEKVAASLTNTDIDSKARMKMDSEGGLRGGNRGKGQMMSDLAVSLLMAKLADKAVDMPIEIGLGAASSAAGPYVSVATGLILFFGRHGKDASLSKYTELEITFSRPLTIAVPEHSQVSPR